MITIVEKKNCCGCAACVQRCPKRCVSMREDNEGFLYPQVDVLLCIDCGLCEKVCPVISRNDLHEPLKVYAAKNRDTEKRELSSSGGLFIALAEQVIADGGAVFGVVFDDHWEAHHVVATTTEGLQPMMRSKYIQSRTENTFVEAEQYLKQGLKVMYTGTSCQIAGLKRFLRKDYTNLLAVDVICHGVPSPGVWRRYLEELLENKLQSVQSVVTDKKLVLNFSLKSMPEIADISFREKHRSGYDWQKFGFVIWQKSTSKANKNSVLSAYKFVENPFVRGFLHDIYLRPSCYACPAKGGTSGADITIADYWGIWNVRPNFYDSSGVGLAIIHTDKGLQVFGAVNFNAEETSLEEAITKNKSYWRAVSQPQCREAFFLAFSEKQHIEAIVSRLLYKSIGQRILTKAKIYTKRSLQLLLRIIRKKKGI